MTSDERSLRCVLMLIAVLVASCGHAMPRASVATIAVLGFGRCPEEPRERCIELRVANGTDRPVSFLVTGRTEQSALHCHNYYFDHRELDECVSHGKVKVIRAGGAGHIWVYGQREDLNRGLFISDNDGVEYDIEPPGPADRR